MLFVFLYPVLPNLQCGSREYEHLQCGMIGNQPNQPHKRRPSGRLFGWWFLRLPWYDSPTAQPL